jgi:uncharacterized protein (DUF488 family)
MGKTERFAAGLERLLTGAGTYRVAILCSEENPEHCHRRLLVGRVLTDRAITVLHIRGDGSVISEEDLGRLPEDAAQGALFGAGAAARKSTRSVTA